MRNLEILGILLIIKVIPPIKIAILPKTDHSKENQNYIDYK